ncbi:MAG: alkaline phosphatase D family protein [candidate division KSB1 bacterium]|nr:alkaline phosphatase D family protein [candidate division KSB1 bacterium]MDZ7274433.1 alkaline phosphatase D family protein [candidate division KSB1 bacterium]MDZ7284905.1 alkaline phosphatase D family protein [candidate division KSB1 bacterium]MDZ7297674.1 alkaline phosphatase D family protein [candidate division KSB1 bacterium]MDZ7305902.1 alkaline phosphatase D family protein [candidate division KSB1 bacterium]
MPSPVFLLSAWRRCPPHGLLVAITVCVVPLSAQTLTHGPFVGAVTSQSARFYARVVPAAAVAIELATTPDFNDSRITAALHTDSLRDYAALLELSGLQSDQRYYYRTRINGQPAGEVRRFKTFPREGGRAPFQFAFGSCIVVRRQPQPGDGRVFTAMKNDDLRFFLQIGDWCYPDTTDSPAQPQRVFSADLRRVQESYRAKYDTTHALQQVLRTTPVDYVYDDHDYLNDDASALSYPRNDSMRTITVPPVARENSLRAYRENFPGYPLPNPQAGIWHKFTCGNADFFMLDTRSQRRPNLEAFVYNPVTDSIEFAPGPQHSMLAGYEVPGENQMDWLFRELQASTADWKFLVSTVPFNRGLRPVIDLSVSMQDSILTVPGYGTGSLLRVGLGLADKWVGFPADQERLLQFLAAHDIKNVIVLSGDSHTAAIDDGSNAGLPEAMAGALEQSNSRLVFLLELFRFNIWNGGGQNSSNGNFNDAYGRVTVFGADSVRLEIVDEFGALVAAKTVRSAATSAVTSSPATPRGFTLSHIHPNPFSPTQPPFAASIVFAPAPATSFEVMIYDLAGRRILRRLLPGGARYFRWTGNDETGTPAASGVYFVRVTRTEAHGRRQVATQKLLLLR